MAILMSAIKNSLLTSMVLVFFACSNDSSSDLIEPAPVLVKYNDNVKPIIDANCVVCHKDPPINFAPMKLTTLEDVKNAILDPNIGLIDRISRAQGASGFMPSGGTRLPQATIDLIKKWEKDGFQQ